MLRDLNINKIDFITPAQWSTLYTKKENFYENLRDRIYNGK